MSEEFRIYSGLQPIHNFLYLNPRIIINGQQNQKYCHPYLESKFKNPFDLVEDEEESEPIQPLYNYHQEPARVHSPLPFNPYTVSQTQSPPKPINK